MAITLGWTLIHDILLMGNQLLVPIKYLVKSPLVLDPNCQRYGSR